MQCILLEISKKMDKMIIQKWVFFFIRMVTDIPILWSANFCINGLLILKKSCKIITWSAVPKCPSDLPYHCPRPPTHNWGSFVSWLVASKAVRDPGCKKLKKKKIWTPHRFLHRGPKKAVEHDSDIHFDLTWAKKN